MQEQYIVFNFGSHEMGRWEDGEVGRWGGGEVGRWGGGEMGRWGGGEVGECGEVGNSGPPLGIRGSGEMGSGRSSEQLTTNNLLTTNY
jgi:hypothetical protein